MKKFICYLSAFLLISFGFIRLQAVSVDLNVTGGLSSTDNITITTIDVTTITADTIDTTTMTADSITTSTLTVTSSTTINNMIVTTITATVGTITSLTASTITLNGNTIRGSTNAATVSLPNQVVSSGDFMLTSATQTSSGKKTFGELATSSITVSIYLTIPTNAAPQANIVPSSIGQLIVNTGATPDEVCFATATVVESWVRISTPTATCSN